MAFESDVMQIVNSIFLFTSCFFAGFFFIYSGCVALIWPSWLTGCKEAITNLHVALIWPSRLTGCKEPITNLYVALIWPSRLTRCKEPITNLHVALIWPSLLTGRKESIFYSSIHLSISLASNQHHGLSTTPGPALSSVKRRIINYGESGDSLSSGFLPWYQSCLQS